jgi:predicted negative regulator of RcsB-dependent stress response
MGRIKISRKKLLQEPDEFLGLSQRVWLWVHDNRGRAAAGVGVAAGVLLLAIVAKGLIEHSREQRAAEVAAAIGRYTEPKEGAAVPDDVQKQLDDLATRHAGSAEGLLARYFLAGAAASKGDLSRAAEVFGKVEADARDSQLAELARVAKAYLLLSGGDADRALAAFQELIAAKDAVVPRSQLRLEVGMILEKKNQTAEARRVYEELERGNPEGTFAAKAKERLRILDEHAKAAS